MRGLTLLLLLAGALVDAAAADYVEVRDLSLDIDGVGKLLIETGAGPMVVSGDPSATSIAVTATITVPRKSAETAQKKIENDLILTLERNGSEARLFSKLENGFFDWNNSMRLELAVVVPAVLDVTINDGSGSMEISGIGGALRIEDGSGSFSVENSGSHVTVVDGSGSIEIEGVAGDVHVDDGSGSLRVEQVGGSVFVDDGSGGIDVRDVAADLIVANSGSGRVEHRGVRGRVVIDE